MLAPLPTVMLEPMVRAALLEDLGRAGDITTDAIVPADLRANVALVSREAGILAGLDLAALAFRLIDPSATLMAHTTDGAPIAAGEVIATISGAARGLLTAERVALNYLSHLSGIATATAAVVASLHGLPTRVVCTRKTLPGLRALQKYAVRAGGGSNHRFGLDDAVLIKDNHIALAGSVTTAVQRARGAIGHLVKVEVEVDTLAQLDEALRLDVDAILLDNMDLATLRQAVATIGRRALTEASGGITAANARDIAATGVNMISLGWLTHSTKALDIGLDACAADLC